MVAFVAGLTGCGVSYNSPSVKEAAGEGASVTVVPLTAATVGVANQSAYSPRSLPDVFYAVAGNGSLRNTGTFPTPPDVPNEQPEANYLDPPPNADPGPYRIGVGDVILLATRGSATTIEQLSGLLAAQNSRQGYTVRDDGAIAIPEIGAVNLAGMTLQEAEDQLFNVLVENQIDPSFSLEVAEFNSQRVAVGGAVGSAGIVPIGLKPLTLGDALVTSGGIAVKDEEFGSIRVYRDGRIYQIPVATYLARPEFQGYRLQNGDAIYVDRTYDLDRAFEYYQQKIDVISLRSGSRTVALSALETEIRIQRAALQERRAIFEARAEFDAEDRDFVYLAGEVAKQSRVALPYGRQATLADVLYEKGGFNTTTGDPSEIYVLRAAGSGGAVSQVTAYHLDAKNAANMVLATRMEMRPNDIVFIEEQVITKWARALQQIFPTLISTAGAAATN